MAVGLVFDVQRVRSVPVGAGLGRQVLQSLCVPWEAGAWFWKVLEGVVHSGMWWVCGGVAVGSGFGWDVAQAIVITQ